VMAMLFSYVLGWANKAFEVESDLRVDAVLDALPGANCGGCGCVGCGEYATAVVAGDAPVNRCTVGGAACAQAIAAIMGVEAEGAVALRPIVHCGAHRADRLQRNDYRGEPSCLAANTVNGIQGCTFGCLGFGDCRSVCAFDAIRVVDGLATVDYQKCVGCGRCAKACPRHIIVMTPFEADSMPAVLCSNRDAAKQVKAVCRVGCIACKLCQRESRLFRIEDNLARLDAAQCLSDGLTDVPAAIDKCPNGVIAWVGGPCAPPIGTPRISTPVEADIQRAAGR